MSGSGRAPAPKDGGGNRFVCIHGHFYQPPRENPWLERVEVEDSAAPYHDWNERITAECYAPNAHARIVNGPGNVQRMINNYAWVSFNFGPTLLAWMEQCAPDVLRAVQEADRRSVERAGGHGNAIAQAYNHLILPLAARRDKVLQVIWGMEVFRHYFNRDPEGMWLPETAVDTESLEVLAEHGIRFTILSPRQAARVRPPDGGWTAVDEHALDTRRPYRCQLPSGREIALFFYDGEMAQRVAFQRILNDGEGFRKEMLDCFDAGEQGPQLVHFATDGETFGHHHRFGEMALAYFISCLEEDADVRLVNYGTYLSMHPPVWQVEIVENSSWSCAHGVERWRSDCGCRLGGPTVHQRWRAPLRQALDGLKEKLDGLYEREGQQYFQDSTKALHGYIEALLERDPDRTRRVLDGLARRPLNEEERSRALKLLEMQRHGQLMFTSCGWFFDDLSGIETVQILKLAARAIQLAEKNFGASLEGAFLDALEKAPSNDPSVRDGRRLWETEVRPEVTDLGRVLAHFAVSRLLRRTAPSRVGNAYAIRQIDAYIQDTGFRHFALGVAEVGSIVTLQETRHVYAVLHFGGLDVQFFCGPFEDDASYERLKGELVELYERASLGDLYTRLLSRFQEPTHQLADLFLDEQREIIEMILHERVGDYQALFEQFFEQDQELLRRLTVLKYPVPGPMRMAAGVALEGKIRSCVEGLRDTEGLETLSALLEQGRHWGHLPDPNRWERPLLLLLESRIRAIREGGDVPAELCAAECLLTAAERMGVKPNLWHIQNLYVETCRELAQALIVHKEEVRRFLERLHMDPPVLPEQLR